MNLQGKKAVSLLFSKGIPFIKFLTYVHRLSDAEENILHRTEDI